MYICRLVITKYERFKSQSKEQYKKLREKVSANKKGIILLILSIFFLFWKKDIIEKIVSNYLISEFNFSEPLTDFLVVLLFLIIAGYQIQLLIRRYKTNFQEFAIIFFFVFAYALFRFEVLPRNWDYYSFSFMEIYYLDVLVGGIALFIIVSILSLASSKSKLSSQNLILEDNPIDDIDKKSTDVFQREELINKIVEIIKRDKYKKAVSIGIIGPWGNGKSSLLNQVKEQLKDASGFIIVDFQPFLNHSEVSIIDDFFASLDQALSKYSGSLSKYIEKYTHQLIKYYRTGGVGKFNEWQSSNSATNLYGKIDKAIKRINKKIVVFVDDLDRLSGTEIVQVLKLIRNTANFHNTLFLVALDKDYAIKALLGEKEYQNHRFLEKFFQLEIFLPEIQKNTLKQEFFKILERSERISEDAFKQIEEAVAKDHCYFSYANRNLRDVKKLANQLTFENHFIDLGLDYCDLINFLILKLRFPKVVQLIDEQREKIFDFDFDDYYSLKVSRLKGSEDQKTEETEFSFFGKNQSPSMNFESFQVLNLKDDKGDWFRQEMGVSILEDDLLFRLMVAMWGRFYRSPNSIQYSPNFNKVLRLKYGSKDLKGFDYAFIKKIETFTTWHSKVESLLEQDMGTQILHKLIYDYPRTDTELKSVLTFLLLSLRKLERYGLSFAQIKEALGKWLNPIYWEGNDRLLEKEYIRSHLLDGFFLSDKHSLLNRVEILSEVWIFRKENGSLGLDIGDFLMLGKLFVDKYLNSSMAFDPNFWFIYGRLKDISGLKAYIKETSKRVLSQASIVKFCQISLWMDGTPHFIKLSDFALDIFGSIEKFEEFIINHPDGKNEEIQEFLHFIKIQKLVGKDQRLRYAFNRFKPEIESANVPPQVLENDEKIMHVIFKFKSGYRDPILKQIQRGTPESNLFNRSSHIEYENNEYLLLSFSRDESDLFDLMKILCEGALEIGGEGTELLNIEKALKNIDGRKDVEGEPIVLKDEMIISIISIQPSPNMAE